MESRYSGRGLGKIPGFLTAESTVVEVGTGGGWNLVKFKEKGLKHYGLDFDESLINYGRQLHGLNLLVGGVSEAVAWKIRGDYILLLEVLEHTTDPVTFLRDLKQIANDDGLVNVKVPSADSMRLFGGGDIGYDLLDTLQGAHNFLFDSFTLRFAALKARWKIIANFSGNLILRNSPVPHDSTDLRSIESELTHRQRGPRVIRYLRHCEAVRRPKMRILRGKSPLNLYPLCYVMSPVQVLRKIFLYKFNIG
jgi:2-polyprenyl-3-methyl-5-hydroxy-6-metoxy-1,4-benzoquinol methylase